MTPEWPFYVYILFILQNGVQVVFYVGGAWSLTRTTRIYDHTETTGSKHAQKFIREHLDMMIHSEVYAYCLDKTTVDLLEPKVWDEFILLGHPVQLTRPGGPSVEALRNSRDTNRRLGYPGLRKGNISQVESGQFEK